MNMEVGLVGKPNVGKSTFFAAATRTEVEMASYPFTTIEANIGVGYIRAPCPHDELGVTCEPNHTPCVNGIRMIPVKMIDVAGLVPDAHAGKGLGNKFLDDLRQASVLIHIVDSSGSTNSEGEPCPVGQHDPVSDVAFLEREIDLWIKGILENNWKKVSRKLELVGGKLDRVIFEQVSGLGVSEAKVSAAIRDSKAPQNPKDWDEETLYELARNLRLKNKPIIIAANKADQASEENLTALGCLDTPAVTTAAEYELAIRKASEKELVDYSPGEDKFNIKKDDITPSQMNALQKIRGFMEINGGLGVQQVLEKAVYDLLDMIVVYPVENEHNYTDKEGRVLPDAYLMPRGSTSLDLAYAVHTDIGEGFIRAVDARSQRVIGRDHILKDGDIIKIVSSR